MGFRDRLVSARVRRAMVAPWTLVATGGTVAIGLIADLPVAGVATLGGAAWVACLGGAALTRPTDRRRRRERVDPFTLSEPWRRYVQGALAAQARFERTVDNAREGPLRDRLKLIGARLGDAVDEVWRIASGGHTIDRGLSTLDTRAARAQLAELETGNPLDVHATAMASALEAQLDTASRMQEVSTDAQGRLRLLDARLDELVARAVELSVSGSTAGMGGLGDDVDVLVQEMEALRQAVEEIDKVARPELPPLPPPGNSTPPG